MDMRKGQRPHGDPGYPVGARYKSVSLFTEEEKAALLDWVWAGAGEIGGGGDSAEEHEPVPECAEKAFV